MVIEPQSVANGAQALFASVVGTRRAGWFACQTRPPSAWSYAVVVRGRRVRAVSSETLCWKIQAAHSAQPGTSLSLGFGAFFVLWVHTLTI